ncbi:AAA family ATPase [Clostridium septicum]|uniref:Nuclease SbcCD subunit C n=1 Tax=Clostridium septicum TaxID=1504 RepID=A0A9N7PK52_CLOSE|nr:AAA family ATPase [Clostridium septicum]AYE35280.1 hypothetical protein CP523_13075 [Clostridium septicum]MDU1313908.1 AAA family ATPase [Clostridium septicum]QAS60674.1 hypothetical protein EI377_07945 [Clostridium septicum]UEC20068.1 AAA family ATPase [Clostridium septicum]USS01876.1 AAA family ATPase [Clostridium septicum]
MEIKLKRLRLKNFKGIKERIIEFNEITNIFGENGTGKTTIFDAFTWVMFDKDSKDRKDFDIKTLDIGGQVIPYLDHQVTATIEVDGSEIIFDKLYKEKWVKKRGFAERSFDGHETLYTINDIPVKKAEYNSKVNELLAENTFKLISNPLYFNTLNWKNRREILMDIIGDIDSDRVIAYNEKLKPLEGELQDGIENFSKTVKAKIKRLKDQVKSIPYRVDELNNSIVEHDFIELEKEKLVLLKEIKKNDDMLQDGNKANDEYFKLKEDLYELKKEFRNKEEEARLEAAEPVKSLERKIRALENEILDRESYIESLERKKENEIKNIDIFNKKVIELRSNFKEEKEKEFIFNERLTYCPTCKRQYETNDIEHIKEDQFNSFCHDKQSKLENISKKGHELNSNKKIAEEKLTELEKQITEEKDLLEADQTSLKMAKEKLSNVSTISEIKFDGMEELKSNILDLEIALTNFSSKDNNAAFKDKKKSLECELSLINKKLYQKEVNNENRKRISVLEAEERELSEKIAKLEGQEFLGEQFIKTKVELLESTINEKFENVNFKLFDIQINGGLNETCEALIDGVPFSNANTASQINAGIDIINTLSRHYNVTAPIFIDNRESVNNIIKTNSQVINLVVSQDKELRVE